ncbi:MAG TPA: DUF1360 domain-containing protein [Bryobacteraceae bacterium]
MLTDQLWFRFIVAALATWRITHLIVREDGPWRVIVRIRRSAGAGFWGELMDCFYCSSVWVAAIFSFTLRPNLEEWILYWLGLSGSACLLERIGQEPVIIQSATGGAEGRFENAVLRTKPGASEDSSAIQSDGPADD